MVRSIGHRACTSRSADGVRDVAGLSDHEVAPGAELPVSVDRLHPAVRRLRLDVRKLVESPGLQHQIPVRLAGQPDDEIQDILAFISLSRYCPPEIFGARPKALLALVVHFGLHPRGSRARIFPGGQYGGLPLVAATAPPVSYQLHDGIERSSPPGAGPSSIDATRHVGSPQRGPWRE